MMGDKIMLVVPIILSLMILTDSWFSATLGFRLDAGRQRDGHHGTNFLNSSVSNSARGAKAAESTYRSKLWSSWRASGLS